VSEVIEKLLLSLHRVLLLLKRTDDVNFDVQLIFKFKHELKFVSLEKQDVTSILSNTTCSSRTMHKAVYVSATALDHNINVIDVQTSSCDIRSHKNIPRVLISIAI
jgi:hypothetical protein